MSESWIDRELNNLDGDVAKIDQKRDLLLMKDIIDKVIDYTELMINEIEDTELKETAKKSFADNQRMTTAMLSSLFIGIKVKL